LYYIYRFYFFCKLFNSLTIFEFSIINLYSYTPNILMKKTIFSLAISLWFVTSLYAGNTAPTISTVSDINLCSNSTATYNFTIGDAETPANLLTVTYSSPCGGIPYSYSLSGTGTTRTLTIKGLGNTFTCEVSLSVKDGNGAVTTTQFKLSLYTVTTTASILGLPASVCSTSPVCILDASIPGGTFSGSGIVSGAFNPSILTAGSYVINYTYTDSYCYMTASSVVTVKQAPAPPTITTTDYNVCEDGKVNVTLDNDYMIPIMAIDNSNLTYNRFYTEASGGTPVYNEQSKGIKSIYDPTIILEPVTITPVVPAGQSTAYYVSLFAQGTGCESARVGPIIIHTVGKPQAPTLSAGACIGTKATGRTLPITATTDNPTDKFYWREGWPGSSLIYNIGLVSNPFIINDGINGTYYVHTVSVDGCVSAKEISFPFSNLVITPISTLPEYCQNTKVNITLDFPNFTSGVSMNVINGTQVVASKVTNFTESVNMQTVDVYKQGITSCRIGSLIKVTGVADQKITDKVDYGAPTTFCTSSPTTTMTANPYWRVPADWKYAWYDANNILLAENAQSQPSYTVNTSPDQNYTYYLAYKNACGVGPKLTLTLLAAPAYPSLTGQQICPNAANFNASVTNANNLNTYTWETSSHVIVSTLPTATFRASYLLPGDPNRTMWVTAQNKITGCSLTVPFNPIQVTTPALPTSGDASICGPGNVTLTAAQGELVYSSGITSTYNWYSTATGGTPLGTGTPFTTSILTTTDFYVAAANNCYESASRTKVTATVLPTPVLSFSAPPVCIGSAATIAYTGQDESGNAILFNGTNAYGKLNREVKDDFTIEFWMKTSSASSSGTEWWQGEALVDASVTGVNNDFGVSLLNNKAAFGIGNPDQTIQSVTSVNDGSWHHIAAVRNASTSIQLYVDGILEASSVPSNTASLDAAAMITVALKQDLDYTRTNVQMDELRIWNLARSSSNIHDFKNTVVQTSTLGLVGYYSFDEAISTKTSDQSSSANDMTLTGGVTFSSLNNVVISPIIQWSPATYLNATTGTPVISTTPASINYTTIITGKNGCAASTIVPIIVSAIPAAPNASSYTQCSNDTDPLVNFILSASGAVDNTIYVWYDNAGTVFKTSTDYLDNTISFPSNVSRTFSVSVKNTTCESTKTPVTYTVNQSPANPVIVTDLTGPVCGGTSGYWGIQRDGVYTLANYKIVSFPMGCRFNSETITATIVEGFNVTWGFSPGTIAVELTDPVTNCKAIGTAELVLKPFPSSPVVPTVKICTSDTATFTATGIPDGDYTYKWYSAPDNNVLVATGATYNAMINQFVSYYVSIIDNSNGCESPRVEADGFVDNTSANLTPPVVTYSTSGCPNSNGNYQITKQSGFTYTVTLPDGTNIVSGSCNDDGNYQGCNYVFGNTSGNLIVTGTNSSGCVVTSQNPITVLEVPTVNAVSPNDICTGNTTNIPLTSPTPNVTFSWTASLIAGSATGYSDGSGASISQTLAGSGEIRYDVMAIKNNCLVPVTSIYQVVNAFQVSVAVIANPPYVTTTQAANKIKVTYTATAVNAGSSPVYQWTVDNVVKGTNSPTFTTANITFGSRIATASQVRCIVMSNMACAVNNPATSTPVTVSINCPSCRDGSFAEIETAETETSLSVGPNPFSGYINLSIPLLDNEHAEIIVIDLNGKVIEQFVSSESQIKLGNSWANGLYVLKVIVAGDTNTYKIVKVE
jgi:hypothetical protein